MFVQIFGVRECLVVKVKFIMLREEDREYLKSLSPEERFTGYLLGSVQGQDAKCTYKLGDCYTDGEFVKRDKNVAFTLYCFARLRMSSDRKASVADQLG